MPMGLWTCDELAVVLNVAPQKTTQAWDPSVTKVARAMLADPFKTHTAIMEAMELVLLEKVNGRARMSPAEFERMYRIQTGRMDSAEIRPVR